VEKMFSEIHRKLRRKQNPLFFRKSHMIHQNKKRYNRKREKIKIKKEIDNWENY